MALWWDKIGQEPNRLPVVLLQPTVKLKETEGFARNAQWALLHYHPWADRGERFLATNDDGEPLEKDYAKQYFQDNDRPARGVRKAADRAGEVPAPGPRIRRT